MTLNEISGRALIASQLREPTMLNRDISLNGKTIALAKRIMWLYTFSLLAFSLNVRLKKSSKSPKIDRVMKETVKT